MATPQPPYSQPGPSYFHAMQHPIPPPYVYGAHAPPHNAAPYPYSPYPQSPMHAPGAMHHAPPNAHRGRGGYHPSRGGGAPTYQTFQPPVHHHNPQQHANPYMHAPIPPQENYAQPHHPHSKYQVPFSPPAPYPPVPIQPGASPSVSAAFSPAWSAEVSSPLSPLPKQLMMPPPMSMNHTYQPQRAPQSPAPQASPRPREVQAAPPEAEHTFVHEQPQEIVETAPAPTSLESEPEQEPAAAPQPEHKSPKQTSFIPSPISPECARGSLPSTSSPKPKPTTGGWAVWSRRPKNPSHAPGIIFASRSRPPPDVVESALDERTPPPSPVAEKVALPAPEEPEATTEAEESKSSAPAADVELPDKAERLSTPPDVPSSAATATATETTPATSTAPGSPFSTTTSISAAARAPTPSPKAEDRTEAATSASASSTPAPAPQAKAAPKSWASLLRPEGAASSSKLPRSSVVGISIPASSLSSPSGGSTSGSGIPGVAIPHKAELLSLLSSGPGNSANGGPMRIRPRGLVNQGNMCFANAVLQVLVYCPPFHRLFTELGKYLPLPAPLPALNGSVPPAESADAGTPLVDATIRFLREFLVDESAGKGKEKEEDGEGDATDWFVPGYVYDAMKEKKRFENMRGGHQEDAEEFFGFYLDTLEEELLSLQAQLSPASTKAAQKQQVEERLEEEPSQKDEGWMEVGKRNRTVVTRTIRTTESPITRIFGGKFRSTLRAPQQRDSVIVEDWRSIRLDIQRENIHTIKDALSYISHPEQVQMTAPNRPGVTIEASQQVLIDSLPPILVLHLKRFLYDTSVGGVVKIGKQITFGPEVEIGPELMAPARKMATPARYKLFGVLYHHGLSASGGHYTIDVLHPNREGGIKPREGWIRIDDEFVSDIRPEDVFNSFDRDDRNAYLLMYRRIGWGAQAVRT
ncbi:cysteine proteinase [Gloeophyllum trabeum ATCC 11539]|uniref:Ubiquitin carboxyl-terminal hydrolase n=1 Tax=Gloeophyllum trabeum (strain ATCC 11539 / FP-39264 / Madison 617) TaxID=670483 RepID=S7RWS5_GLOTA|nr:cysteine proteinase [Gloeophyllum trabeum ATCC 11539]EPQ57809.1 cysteine proteinase [Gloeophyllum trabeum ATCC 11539]